MTNRHASLISGIGSKSLLMAAVAIGCDSGSTSGAPLGSAGDTSVTTGGTTGSNGGTTNVGGTNSVGGNPSPTGGTPNSTGGVPNPTGGTPSVSTGGNMTTGGAMADTGGAAPDATGGAATDVGGGGNATGGDATTATGGSSTTDCNAPVATKCTGTTPPAALVSDFSIAASSTAPSVFGNYGQSVYGGTFIYPANVTSPGPCDSTSAYPLTQDLTGGNWHVQGTVGTYSGLGLWWNCNTGTATTPAYAGACVIDASAYTGISFTVSGTIGPVSSGTGTVGLSMQVATPSTMAPKTDSAGNPKNCGTCAATTCGTNVAVAVSGTAATVKMTWAQLGVTETNAVAGISFSFTDPCSLNNGYSTSPCKPTTYPVNVTIDDIQFTTN